MEMSKAKLTPDEIEKKKEERREYKREWYKKNKEAIQSRQREWRSHNKEKINEYQKKWRKNNVEKVAAYEKKRKSHLAMAEEVKELTPEQITKAKEARNAYMREWRRKHKAAAQEACLRYCGKNEYEQLIEKE